MTGSGRDRASIQAELALLTDSQLTMLLADWRRWRARVQSEPTMRLRRERYDEASVYIDAICEEMSLRRPGERDRRREQAARDLHELAEQEVVLLDDYRRARADVRRLAQPAKLPAD